jgi:hypothetical protein
VIEEMLLMNYAERAYTGHRSEERMHKHPPALHKERFVKKKEQKGRVLHLDFFEWDLSFEFF